MGGEVVTFTWSGVVHDYSAHNLPNQEHTEFSCKYFL